MLPKACSIYCKTIKNLTWYSWTYRHKYDIHIWWRVPNVGPSEKNTLFLSPSGLDPENLNFAKVVPKHFCRGFHAFHDVDDFIDLKANNIKPFERGLEVRTFEGFKSAAFCHDEEFQGRRKKLGQMDFDWVVVMKSWKWNCKLYCTAPLLKPFYSDLKNFFFKDQLKSESKWMVFPPCWDPQPSLNSRQSWFIGPNVQNAPKQLWGNIDIYRCFINIYGTILEKDDQFRNPNISSFLLGVSFS